LPGAPITKDQWAMLGRDAIVSGANGMATLGVAETPLEAVAEGWLDIYRRYGRFTVKAA
jgi:NADH dehydrogenase